MLGGIAAAFNEDPDWVTQMGQFKKLFNEPSMTNFGLNTDLGLVDSQFGAPDENGFRRFSDERAINWIRNNGGQEFIDTKRGIDRLSNLEAALWFKGAHGEVRDKLNPYMPDSIKRLADSIDPTAYANLGGSADPYAMSGVSRGGTTSFKSLLGDSATDADRKYAYMMDLNRINAQASEYTGQGSGRGYGMRPSGAASQQFQDLDSTEYGLSQGITKDQFFGKQGLDPYFRGSSQNLYVVNTAAARATQQAWENALQISVG
jgi:hypothetical protein